MRGEPSGADRVQVDQRGDPARVAPALGEVRGPEAAVGPAVGRDEDDRVRERGAAEVARQLEERARAGGVVVRARRDAQVVPVRQNDDGALGLGVRRSGARGRRDDVDELLGTEPGDVGGEGLPLDREAVLAELALDPVGGFALAVGTR